jgi:CheY-like chemotaxis protein
MSADLLTINLKNKRILIVEDDIVNFEYLRELLEMAKAKIIHAATGLEALELFNQQNIDAVLLDIKIPPPDGLEVARLIKSSDKKKVPVIAQTAKAFQKDKKDCLDAGCDEYISKPFPINELFEKLNKHIN